MGFIEQKKMHRWETMMSAMNYHSEVQQRGVAATTTIILELLEGIETPLLIVDLVPSRQGSSQFITGQRLNEQSTSWFYPFDLKGST